MFFVGFFIAWFIIAIFILYADMHHGIGIELSNGWGSNLLTLPVLIIILPANFIVTKILKRKNKKQHS